ncbi:MAG: YcgL domain-containing protein [Gammaproteobacteria bacterium]|nr:YcgL domain-containing protein [Gammaproteobacteria bacterium]
MLKCVIFRCSKKQEMYLYVPWQEDESLILSHLPEGLLTITGQLEKVMELELTSERKLARANVTQVMAELVEKGFYLQSPPNQIFKSDQSVLHNPSDTF